MLRYLWIQGANARLGASTGGILVRRLSTATSSQPTTNYNIVPGLKKMMKPFYLKCHPDVQPGMKAKEVNLACLQTLNGFMDTMEATTGDSRRVEWPRTLELEFLLTIEDERIGLKNRERRKVDTTSRRRVEIKVPEVSLRDKVLSLIGRDKKVAVRQLEQKVQKEFAKILRVAGLEPPLELPSSLEDVNEIDLEAAKLQAVQDEIFGGDGPSLDKLYGRRTTRKPRGKITELEQTREAYVKRMDWKKHRRLYEEALRQARADMATRGSMDDPRLRQEFITGILSRVRIDKDAEIDIVNQLITMRRLSLILMDNFDLLLMEDYGRMWEELLIILTEERPYGTSSSALHKRRLKGLEETGFQFTYDAEERISIHIPIDFRDDELVQQLERNLFDFAELNEMDTEEFTLRWPEYMTRTPKPPKYY